MSINQRAHRILHPTERPIQDSASILGHYFDGRFVHSPFLKELLLVISRPDRLDGLNDPFR